MRSTRLALGLSLLNALLLLGIIISQARSAFAKASSPDVLRGRGLEIVDDAGRPRAIIRVSERAVLLALRSADPNSGPGVKLGISENGAALSMSNGTSLSDGRSVGIQLHTSDPRILVINAQGNERELKP